MKPPMTAQEAFIDAHKEKCLYTGRTIPECCCYDCMYARIRLHHYEKGNT